MTDQPETITCDECGRIIERAYLPHDGRILCLVCAGLVQSENDLSERDGAVADDES